RRTLLRHEYAGCDAGHVDDRTDERDASLCARARQQGVQTGHATEFCDLSRRKHRQGQGYLPGCRGSIRARVYSARRGALPGLTPGFRHKESGAHLRHVFILTRLFSMHHIRSLILAATLIAPCMGTAWAQSSEDEWVDLFNGKDLSGWETWLSRAPGERTMLGLNNDPLKVFTVQDGMIYISGQVFGGLTTIDEYEDFHLLVEFKWGEKKWPPRQNQARDGGISYYATGAHGVFAGSFMKSNQFQLQEGGTGDFYSVAGTIADVEAVRDGDDWRYAPGGEKTTIN